jgi:hypothetical protein
MSNKKSILYTILLWILGIAGILVSLLMVISAAGRLLGWGQRKT